MITLIAGGARSGKSSFAESVFKDKTDVVYIATSRFEDEEMKERIRVHQDCRPKEWRTFEANYDLTSAINSEHHYILDCLTVLTSNIMFDLTKDMETIDRKTQQTIEDTVCCELINLINQIQELNFHLVIVTNEVGCAIVPDNHISRVYRDLLGRVNQRIATLSDEVYFLFCGLPVKLK